MNVNQVLELARKDLEGCSERCEEFIPKALMFQGDNFVGITLVPLHEHSKSVAFKALGEFCFDNLISRVVLIIDTYMKEYRGVSDPSKIDKLPSEYPPEERGEALMILSADFRDLTAGQTLMAPYERKGSMISFASDKMESNDIFHGIIPACIFGGFLYGFLKKKVLQDTENAFQNAEQHLKEFFEEWFHGYTSVGVEFISTIQSVIME